jgi:hypothetical protein
VRNPAPQEADFHSISQASERISAEVDDGTVAKENQGENQRFTPRFDEQLWQ